MSLKTTLNRKVFASLIAPICLAIGVVGLTSATEKPERKVFIETQVDLPEKNFTTLVRTMAWPVGYKSKEHTHAGPGPRYVLSGKVEITENGEARQYSAGEAFWHAGGIPHTAENVASVVTKVLIIEMLPVLK